jgi:hypothetical protein
LTLKDCKNIAGRIARLELDGEGMCKEVVLGTYLIFVQGIIDNQLEVRGRRGSRLSVGHELEWESQ